MQTATTPVNQAVAGTRGGNANAEPLNVRKRIGSTVYEVRVYFNQDAKETMNDKILRLIRNEAAMGSPQSQRLCGERRSDGVSELSGLPGSERYEVRDDEKAVG